MTEMTLTPEQHTKTIAYLDEEIARWEHPQDANFDRECARSKREVDELLETIKEDEYTSDLVRDEERLIEVAEEIAQCLKQARLAFTQRVRTALAETGEFRHDSYAGTFDLTLEDLRYDSEPNSERIRALVARLFSENDGIDYYEIFNETHEQFNEA